MNTLSFIKHVQLKRKIMSSCFTLTFIFTGQYITAITLTRVRCDASRNTDLCTVTVVTLVIDTISKNYNKKLYQ